MGKSRKGGSFERELCKQLSEWWAPGRDDIFWRAASSGGRATIRNKQGKKTFGSYGDIAAVDPIGAPLIAACTIEAKRGYTKKLSFMDSFDRGVLSPQQPWEEFIEQAEIAHKLAGSLSWLLIMRRDGRRALVFMPTYFFKDLQAVGAFAEIKQPFARLMVNVRVTDTRKTVRMRLSMMSLDYFLKYAKREHFLKL